MKKAVVVIGAHNKGKSRTIGTELTKLLKIKRRARKFELNGKSGFLRSQSFEESGLDVVTTIKNDSRYDKNDSERHLLVYAARPKTESGSKFNLIQKTLKSLSFAVKLITVHSKGEAKAKSKEVFDILNLN